MTTRMSFIASHIILVFTLTRAPRNKAVAEGAVSFFLQHFVSVRVARLTYGTICACEYDGDDPEHRIRRGRVFVKPSGRQCVPDAFAVILSKVL